MPFSSSTTETDVSSIVPATLATWEAVLGTLTPAQQRWVRAVDFRPKPGRHCVVPSEAGEASLVLLGVDEPNERGYDPMRPGGLATILPPGDYRFAHDVPDQPLAFLSWGLSAYRFTRYKAAAPEVGPRLRVPDGLDADRLRTIVEGVSLGRDLINTPARDMGPEALEAAARDLAERHGARVNVVRGDDLDRGFPLIAAVGAAAHQPPRLVDFVWGRAGAPSITLVGKGVTFDTGGLNIKPDTGMLLMKKDMGGAAAALSLAAMIMSAKLDLRLRVLLPIVENAISATSFRPGDILRSRKGLTVEIGNTDAEGRLILADALSLAGEERPDLICDFATLTGAARVALGPDLPPFFTEDDALAEALAAHGRAVRDPVWRLPLWSPYDAMIEGKIADVNNVGGSPFAGSIVAALFLRRFVEPAQPWVHFDIFGWTPTARPGRPEGGEPQVARLLFDYLATRYPT